MDEELRRRIAASLDLPDDAAADPVVVQALEADPAAQPYARGLYAIERALKAWPAILDRAPYAGPDALLAKIDKTAAPAKVKGAPGLSPDDFDATAAPRFEDETAPTTTEKKVTMSEPNEHDADHEALAALARTSTVPVANAAAARAARPSLVDEVDETSSGLVDIKSLAALSRETRASFPGAPPPSEPPAAAAPAPEAKAEAKPEAKADAPAKKTDAKPGAAAAAKKNDVMVATRQGAAVTPSPAAEAEAPKRNTGPIWAIAGVAATAAAFMIFGPSQQSPTSPAAVEQTAPANNSVPENAAPSAASTPAPTPPPSAAPAEPPASPETAAANTAAPSPPAAPSTEPAAAAPAQMAGPPPAPTVAAGPPPEPARTESVAERAPAAVQRARTAATVAAAPRPAPARPAPATAPAAAPTAARAAGGAAAAPAGPPPAPTPAAAPGAPAARAGRPAAGAPAAAAPAAPAGSVDDLMNRVAGGPARPAAPAAQTAPADDPAALPERLNRSQVTSVLSPLNGAVRSCAGSETGTAPVSLVINGDGTVASASVSGQFGGTPVGECISGVVRRARFPRFRAATQNMMFPYVIAPRQ